MTSNYHDHSDLNSLFFNPLVQVYPLSDCSYQCSSISDLDFAKLGILRCLSHAKTGHQFLQHHADQGQQDIDPSHFFKTLRSKRRLKNTSSLNELLRSTIQNEMNDPFADFKELQKVDIYAADGHYHHAAAFDPKPTNPGEKANATGHFFRLDLRNHHLGHLALGLPDKGKKRSHDVTVIKQADVKTLRNNAPKGRKVLYAWDKACIDYVLWSRLKHLHGIYFITLEKANSAATICSINRIDKSDPCNEGISGDYLVGNNNGEAMRRIIYTDPRDGTTYIYITNEMTIPAYQLVMIYKHRWDIEKVFYQLKSKMEERKSWASSPTAKSHQATFECLAHNLCLLVEERMISEGLKDEVEETKAKGREKSRKNRDGKTLGPHNNFIGEAIKRATHRTARFIRWLQSALYKQCSLVEAIAMLVRVWSLRKT